MDRRVPRTISDPKVRQVGFFTPGPPDRSQSGPPIPNPSSPPVSDNSPSGNSLLNPVMIPPPRHHSTELSYHPQAGPISPLLRRRGEVIAVGSYNPSEITSPSSNEFTETALSNRAIPGKFATSLPSGGFELPPPTVVAKEKGGAEVAQEQKAEVKNSSKPSKEKTTKAERRALQEAQRAAKAAAKGEGTKTAATAYGDASSANPNPGKISKAPSQKKDSSPAVVSEKRAGDRPLDKDRKKDIPHPRMQFDDTNRVEKAKKRSVVKQAEARNRIELFRHLPQYEHGTRFPDFESKFFQLDPVHPAVYKVGLRYLAGDISGGNARCIAMLQAFQESIKDYSTPPEKVLTRDLTAKINCYVSFLIECRPLSISMGNAIRFLKTRIANLPSTLSEAEAKATVLSDIDRFINEKIILADKAIVEYAVSKIRDGDVLLTYGSSSAVEMIFSHAHELGKKFRVVVVDSRPKLEGRMLLRRLLGKGVCCTYTHVNAISYVMHEVTRVLVGASSIFANGTVYSRVGTACVAMVAHQFNVPVLICCEAYKFHERVQLDSICSNELGDPEAITKVHGRRDINSLEGWTNGESLQPLNLLYDVTPADYVSMIITDCGMIPPTSVPVIVREFRREHILT